jgi:hypothetical protein
MTDPCSPLIFKDNCRLAPQKDACLDQPHHLINVLTAKLFFHDFRFLHRYIFLFTGSVVILSSPKTQIKIIGGNYDQ